MYHSHHQPPPPPSTPHLQPYNYHGHQPTTPTSTMHMNQSLHQPQHQMPPTSSSLQPTTSTNSTISTLADATPAKKLRPTDIRMNHEQLGQQWNQHQQQQQLTIDSSDSLVEVPRPDFFSPKPSSSAFERQTGGGNSHLSTATMNGGSLQMHGKKRQRSEDVVEVMLNGLRMDNEEMTPSGNMNHMNVDVSSSAVALASNTYTPTPSPINCASVAAYHSHLSPTMNEQTPSPLPLPQTPSPLATPPSYNRCLMPSNAMLPPNASNTAASAFQPQTMHNTAASSLASDPPSLVDPMILTHLQQHLPSLPCSQMPGLSVDVLVLMLLWKLDFSKLPSGGPLTQAQFLAGLQEIGCQSDQQLQLLLQNMLIDFNTTPAPLTNSSTSQVTNRPAPFKSFYLRCFFIIKKICCPPFKKSLDLPTARYFLTHLLAERFSQHMHPFLAYLNECEKSHEEDHISHDQWSVLYDWCTTINPHTMDGYEVEGSWPVMMDQFVEWLCKRAPTIRLPESTRLLSPLRISLDTLSPPSQPPRISPVMRAHSRFLMYDSSHTNPNTILPLDNDEDDDIPTETVEQEMYPEYLDSGGYSGRGNQPKSDQYQTTDNFNNQQQATSNIPPPSQSPSQDMCMSE